VAKAPKKPRISEAPQEALTRSLKPNKIASLKAEFDAAHNDGMDALKRGDYKAVRHAVDRERKVIDAMPKPASRLSQ